MTDRPADAVSETYDLVVVGSGAAGLTAAITAALKGCRVAVIEADAQIGGTTAWSGGAAWIPCNPHMASIGESDSPERAALYIREILGDRYEPHLVDAFLATGQEMVSFLERRSRAVRFTAYAGSDYHPELRGAASRGRSLMAMPYDGRLLGARLHEMRGPMPELTVFGGMQVDPAEALHLQYAWRRWGSLKTAVRLLSRYAFDRLRFGRGTRLIRGQALLARLFHSTFELPIDIRCSTSARRLIRKGNRITGVVIERDGQEKRLSTRAGVVLATGGFSNDPAMVADFIPDAENHLPMLPGMARGEGLRMGLEAGGTIDNDNSDHAIWMPGSARYDAEGAIKRRYPHFAFDRCKPGSIMVNAAGRRFVNEASSYHAVVRAMRANGAVPAWLIADHRFLRKYGMGLARPFPYPYRHLVREGYLVSAPTLTGLATRLGIDPAALSETADRMNRFAARGVDEDFGKGGDIFTRALGDAEHRPNPCLGPIARPPYYALALYPSDCGTALGLRTDGEARVVDQNGNPIPGLYACGPDMNAAMKGNYPGAGTMIGPAMTFAYAAARHAASTLEPSE